MSKLSALKIFSLVVTITLAGPSFAYAQMAQPDPSSINQGNIDTVLANVEGSAAVASGEDTSELTPEEKRVKAKENLTKALSLALEKVQGLTSDLDGREFPEDSLEYALRNEFLAKLDSYKVFYTDKLNTLDGLETLGDIQTLAKEIKSYRDEVYAPGVEEIVEFVLVFYSEDVINIANERFTRISADLDKLENLGLLEEGVFSQEMADAQELLAGAADLRSHAWEIMFPIEEGIDDNATSTIQEVSEEIPETGLEITEDVPPTVKELLETSLGKVKLAYGKFLEISSSVKETLGIN